MNIYEITTKYLYIQSAIENGEDLPDDLLSEVDEELETKAENYAKVIKNLESDLNGLDEEIKRLTAKKKAVKSGIDRLKENLQNAMILTGKRKFKTDLFSFNIQKNGGALPVIVDADVSELPDELVKITESPDLQAIAAYINETGDVTWAHFGERGESLRIR